MEMKEEVQTTDKDESCVSDFLKYMKLSLAMAIIKNKPSDMSGEQFATQLSQQCKAQSANWEKKAKELQDRVYTLQQQLVLCNSVKQTNTNVLDTGPKKPLKDWDLVELPTPPCSQQVDSNLSSQEEYSCDMSQNSSFINNVITLKEKAAQLEISEEPTLLETIISTVDTIQKDINVGTPVTQLQEDTMQIVIELLNCYLMPDSEHYEKLCVGMLLFVKHIIRTILEHQPDSLNQDSLSRFLILCSSCHHIKFPIINMLSECIAEFTNILRLVQEKQLELEQNKFKNLFHIFTSLEMILVKELQLKNSSLVLGDLERMSSLLEDKLLFISDSFPVYAHCVFHIKSILQQFFTNKSCN